jgi:hypothetical protein
MFFMVVLSIRLRNPVIVKIERDVMDDFDFRTQDSIGGGIGTGGVGADECFQAVAPTVAVVIVI